MNIDFLDEEIDAVRKELKKYGIQMPAFKKIGGILTNDLQEDTAVLHAAIIAINEAIDRKVNCSVIPGQIKKSLPIFYYW